MKNPYIRAKNSAGTVGKSAKRKQTMNIVVPALAAVFLAVVFSVRGMWNVATVVVLVLLLGITAMQTWIYFGFFRK